MGPYNEHLLLQTNFDLSSFSLILGVWGMARAPAKGLNPWIVVGTANVSFLYLITFFSKCIFFIKCYTWNYTQCTEKVEQGTFRENFKNFYRNPHSNVSYGLNVEIKDSLKP